MRAAPLLLIALMLVCAAACGGGGGDDRLSHAELVEQGDAICDAASAQIDRLGDPATLEDIARIGAKLAKIRRSETAKLKALVAPEQDEDAQARMVTALEARDATLKALVASALKHDQAGATKALASAQPLGDRASDAALDLGLLRCAEGG